MPIPIASTNDDLTSFLLANDSALPKTIQLTTIREIKTPNVEYNSGRKACEIIFTIVTKVAITTI